MPIEMPRGLPFSVDTWTPSSKLKRHHFITHAHKDHSQGILAHALYPIYSTRLTKDLLLQYYPQLDDDLFVGIEVGQTLVIDDLDGDFTVTAFDANHCPGAVMFLFEGTFGNILHTGDCRLIPEVLQCLPEKYLGKKGKQPRFPLDYVFLDCTFGRSLMKMPSRQSAIQQVINSIWKHPDAAQVYLTCDLLGQEEILVDVSQTFGCKIYVDEVKNSECYKVLQLIIPEILSQDSSSRFQLYDGFPRLYERAEAKIAEARANFMQEPLIIRPSAQWYVCDEESENRRKGRCDQAVRDKFGVWHVCYSMHSSREELEWALQLLAPKWVVSTTPSCRAVELDYAKNHCFKSERSSDDSFWRLMDINMESPAAADISDKCLSCLPLTETTAQCHSQPMVAATNCNGVLNLSPPSKRLSLTLFGKARLGIQDYVLKHEKQMVSDFDNSSDKVTDDISCKNVVEEMGCKRSSAEKIEVIEDVGSHGTKGDASPNKTEIVTVECEENDERRYIDEKVAYKSVNTTRRVHSLPIGLSTSFGESLRSFYRSMNVSVPQPLPSLVELISKNKCAKRRLH